MPDYRVYFVGPDGHFLNFKPLISGSDDEALAEAKQLVDGYDIELCIPTAWAALPDATGR